jgi:copper chaperone CopZ
MNTQPNTSPATQIRIQGMTCDHCVKTVTRALAGVPGLQVRSVAVGHAVVEAADARAANLAVEAINATGYEAVIEASASTPAPSSGCSCCGGKAKVAN